MGIRLDWEIESDRERVKTSGEDPEARKRRARAWRRLLLFTLFLIAIGAAIVGVVMLRLRQVDAEIRQNLVATVENEVAALRVGDRAAFTSIQRSESDLWLQNQQATYDAYQALKRQPDVVLSGRVIDSSVDGPRGRVQVEEIVGGIPYVRTWFYYRYEDGWRHVPPDYTFWGEERTLTADPLTMRYWAVDEPTAAALADTIPTWLRAGCSILACAAVPTLTIEIVPDDALTPGWVVDDLWRLRVPSPFTGAARPDAVLTPELQLILASILSERLVAQESGNLQPNYPADAYYLRQAIVSWLVKRFTGQETNAFSIDSLAVRYGEQAVGRLLAMMNADSNIGLLSQAAGVTSVDLLEIDWRDYLTWRLTLEQDLIAARDDANILSLYDTNDPVARDLGVARFAANVTGETWVVTQSTPEADAARTPGLRAVATARSSDGREREEVVFFRLVDGVWKRAS